MRVHIVRPTDGWSLQRLAESIALPGTSIGAAPDPAADVNLYVNYYLWNAPSGSRDVGFFTHRHGEDDPGLRDKFDAVARGVDACVAMCGRTARYLPPKPTLIWHELGRDAAAAICAQVVRYAQLGFPSRAGLAATGVVLRRHTAAVAALNDDWWAEVAAGSCRDQLSFDYVAWRRGIPVARFSSHLWRGPLFQWRPHAG
jgi:hypothetical protein